MRILICFRQNGKSVLKSLALFLIIDRQGRNEKKNPTCLANLTPANNAFLVHMPKQEKKNTWKLSEVHGLEIILL